MNDTIPPVPDLSPAEKEARNEDMIQAAFQHLLDTYLASSHRRKTDIITKAFNFAKQAHKGVTRKSGEPYILHPIAVAQVACEEIGLGSTSICAALLHDVVEDTDYTYEDIANLFGVKVANIVEGVTKISGGVFADGGSAQAETFKKLLVTMSDDVRVILIKLSDRVHNMRTLASMPPAKQYKIAGETMYIYAPIADRLGLNKIKTELENLCFKYEHPDEYADISRKIEAARGEIDRTFQDFTEPISRSLTRLGYHFTITSRIKSPYSVWKKMRRQHIDFDQVYDLLAVRVVFRPKELEREKEEIYFIYGVINANYTHHPNRERDWVNNPKSNGYQAIHQTYMKKGDDKGRWVEVQIRSERMDDIAERGLAAHWKYKEAIGAFDDSELERWINSIKEILDDPQPDTLDFLDSFKLNLYAREIMVFTPKGELRTMPAGSTVLDFAFSIHTTLGTHCFGAKINHKLVSRGHVLKSGDQVEVMTSASQHVESDWLACATTAKARTKLQAILRRQNRELARQGERQLRQWLEGKGQQVTTSRVTRLLTYYGFHTPAELYLGIARGETTLDDEAAYYLRGRRHHKGWKRFVPFIHAKVNDAAPAEASDFIKAINPKAVFTVTDDALEHCTVADCCHPIPGDNIVGYLAPGADTVELHHRACEVATQLKAQHGKGILAATWDLHRQHPFRTTIHITGIDDKGVLYAIADVLKGMEQYPIHRITLDTADGVFQGDIDISVGHRSDIADICKRLRAVENVTDAHRLVQLTINNRQ
ncbi:MAG: bifunctional (p)ppGpp synthetase/guanosine-3',5'-bis(diphosphate) 3'-pyrophosphohydrolase [Bacteroidaceae bacterium]|nr:bifunctional (p)ppGpp synthetase/guanosine-3',5'-bis(diphosphate) 3'-pyrophosphohydrolase [Bacteroidaceae bacterium]